MIDIILQGHFPEGNHRNGSRRADEILTADRLAVIPVSTIRYLTKKAGFLLIDSTDSTKYHNFNPLSVVSPDAGWVPPYPYCIDDVRFLA